jgi:sugar phosphate permease
MATPSKSMVGADDALIRSGVRRAGRRLIPLLILLYFVNYLDRVNIAFAGPNGMNDELGLSATAFGVAAGVFFIGYLLLEVPSNLMLRASVPAAGSPASWRPGESSRRRWRSRRTRRC